MPVDKKAMGGYNGRAGRIGKAPEAGAASGREHFSAIFPGGPEIFCEVNAAVVKKYAFSWNLIGDIMIGRPNLGDTVGVETYRLMQFTLRDVLEDRLGAEETDRLFFEAGKLAGREFYAKRIDPVESLDEFVSKTQRILKEGKIGILRVEEADAAAGKVVLTVDEDLDCSGLPELDYETCIYDEGFIASLFECFTQDKWTAKEIDCWCTGARTCRFLITRE